MAKSNDTIGAGQVHRFHGQPCSRAHRYNVCVPGTKGYLIDARAQRGPEHPRPVQGVQMPFPSGVKTSVPVPRANELLAT
jgi:hypothetical protein